MDAETAEETFPNLNRLEQIKLRMLLDRHGEIKSSSEALSLAIEAEENCTRVGAFDPAFAHFKKMQLDFESIAGMLEKNEKPKQ